MQTVCNLGYAAFFALLGGGAQQVLDPFGSLTMRLL
jgi:hypothetical protein